MAKGAKMSFKFIEKSNRGGESAHDGAYMRIAKTKRGVSFTMYGKFIELTGVSKFTSYKIGIEGKRIALISDTEGFKVSNNGNSLSSLRMQAPIKDFNFVSDAPVFIKKDHIQIEKGMIIINYGKAFFESGR